jgi:mannose-6-phosphate isomerase-like protein (cupin superfamily)
MLIDFNEMDPMDIPGMNQGTGTMTVRMYNDDLYRIIPTTLHAGASIGTHMQESGDDMNYIISGTGKAVCDGKEEPLKPGVMHICPRGSEHSIVNTGEEDLVMLTLVVKSR